MSTTWTVPRTSTEWVGPIAVYSGDLLITDWTVAVFPRGYQPASPDEITAPPCIVDGQPGVLVGPAGDWPMPVGTHRIWVRFVRDPEVPVLNDVGLIKVT